MENLSTLQMFLLVLSTLGTGALLKAGVDWLRNLRKDKAQTETIEINNDMTEGLARKNLLKDIDDLTKQLNASNKETKVASQERDAAQQDSRVSRNLLEAKTSEIGYLREQAKSFWMAEGGCLERERINSERIEAMQREHSHEMAELKRDHQQQIDDIKDQLRDAMIFKEKNTELAEENSRLLADLEAKKSGAGN